MTLRLIQALFCILITQLSFGQSEAVLDSLRQGAESHKGVEKLPFLKELAWAYIRIDLDTAVTYGEEMMRIAENSKDSVHVAFAANTYGACLIQRGDFDKALPVTHRALEIRKASGVITDIGSSLSKIGLIYQQQSILDSAIPYQLSALDYFEQANDSVPIAQTYINLASLFDINKDVDKALEYAEKARDICAALNYDYGLGGSLGNMSMLYDKKGDYNKAVEYGEQALAIFKKINSRSDIANQLNNLGFYERKRDNHLEALGRYQEAFQLSDEMGDLYGRVKYRANIAATYVTLEKYKEAEELYIISLKEAREQNINSVIWQCEEGLSNSYEGMGKYSDALYHHKRFKAIQDSIFTLDKDELIQELEVKYQSEKKEREIQELAQKNRIIQLESARSKTILWSSIGIFILILIAGLLFYSRQKARQKTILQQEVIKEREIGLNAIITATEEERKRIARELHDGIGQQLSGIKLAWQKLIGDIKPKAKEEAERLESLSLVLDDACTEVRSISHQMMPKALSEMGLVPAIQDMLAKSLGPTDIRYRFEHFHAEGRFAESIEIGLYRIAQELVNNVIKHSGANLVSVQLFKNKNFLVMIVEDNGLGFDKDKSSDGIGLMNISGRLSSVHGEVNYEPSPESGTVATIRIPLG